MSTDVEDERSRVTRVGWTAVGWVAGLGALLAALLITLLDRPEDDTWVSLLILVALASTVVTTRMRVRRRSKFEEKALFLVVVAASAIAFWPSLWSLLS